jgi:uncharacterized small protein (DUF1192 family)
MDAEIRQSAAFLIGELNHLEAELNLKLENPRAAGPVSELSELRDEIAQLKALLERL